MDKSSVGVVLSLKATHYGHVSLPYGKGHRKLRAKTSLWAKVQMEDGSVADVWITKSRGNSQLYEMQEKRLEEQNADLIGKSILISRSRTGGLFFVDLAQP